MKKLIFLSMLIICQVAVNAQQSNTLKLMPVPKQVLLKTGKFRITNKFSIKVTGDANDTVLYKAVNRAYQLLNRKTGLVFGQQYITPQDTVSAIKMTVNVQAKASMEIGLDEAKLR